jgi:oligo-1,6-glucosidase
MMNWWFERIDGLGWMLSRYRKRHWLSSHYARGVRQNYEGRWDIYFASGKTCTVICKRWTKKFWVNTRDVSSRGAGMTKKSVKLCGCWPKLNMGYHFDGVSLGYVPGQKWIQMEFGRI